MGRSVVCARTDWKKFRWLGCAWSADPSRRKSAGERRRTCGTQRMVPRVFCGPGVGIGVEFSNFKIGLGVGYGIEGAVRANFEIGTPDPRPLQNFSEHCAGLTCFCRIKFRLNSSLLLGPDVAL